MPPTLPTPSERAQALWLSTDLRDHLISATKILGDERTQEMFRALHKGLAGLSMQVNITGSERLSAISPYSVDPWQRSIWIPVEVKRTEGASAPYVFTDPVYRLVGIKRSPVVFDSAGQLVDDWLVEGEDYTWDAETSTITWNDTLSGQAITNTADNGSGLVRCTSVGHGLSTGSRIRVSGLTDVADGVVVVTVVDADTFDIEGSTFATAADTGAFVRTTTQVTGYGQTPVLDDNDNPRYTYDPVYADIQITGASGYPLVDENGDPITEQVIDSYTQGAALTADNLDSPITADVDLHVLSEGTYYVVEALQENPYMWDVTAASIGFTRALRPLGFTPEHVPPLLRCLENALQRGFSSQPFRWALSALAGNPFAYGAGRIAAYELDGDTHYAVVEDYENELVFYCEVPQACNLKTGILKPVGTVVEDYEPLLLEEPVSVTFYDQHQDAIWGRPIPVHQLSNEEIGVGQARYGQAIAWNDEISQAQDLFALEFFLDQPVVQEWSSATNPTTQENLKWTDPMVIWTDLEISNFVANRPLLIRNPKQGWSAVYSVRRSEKGRLYLDGYLPDINDGEVLIAQALVQDAASTTSCEITAWAPALKASESSLQWLVDRVVPTSISVDLTLLQQVWDRLYCPWNEQTGAWHTAQPGQHWETAVGVLWNFNTISWTG